MVCTESLLMKHSCFAMQGRFSRCHHGSRFTAQLRNRLQNRNRVESANSSLGHHKRKWPSGCEEKCTPHANSSSLHSTFKLFPRSTFHLHFCQNSNLTDRHSDVRSWMGQPLQPCSWPNALILWWTIQPCKLTKAGMHHTNWFNAGCWVVAIVWCNWERAC